MEGTARRKREGESRQGKEEREEHPWVHPARAYLHAVRGEQVRRGRGDLLHWFTIRVMVACISYSARVRRARRQTREDPLPVCPLLSPSPPAPLLVSSSSCSYSVRYAPRLRLPCCTGLRRNYAYVSARSFLEGTRESARTRAAGRNRGRAGIRQVRLSAVSLCSFIMRASRGN